MEIVRHDEALKGAYEDILDRNIEKWALFSSFMDKFSRRALKNTHFVRPVAKFIKVKVEEQTGKNWYNQNRSQGLIPDSSRNSIVITNIYWTQETMTRKTRLWRKDRRKNLINTNHAANVKIIHARLELGPSVYYHLHLHCTRNLSSSGWVMNKNPIKEIRSKSDLPFYRLWRKPLQQH